MLPGRQSIITGLLIGQQWPALRQFLASGPGASAFFHFRPNNQSRNTVLHLACLSRAPPDILRHLLDMNPAAAHAQNALGQTPLHIAVATGASADVVKFLLGMNPYAAGLKDSMGRTPLILLCRGGNDENDDAERARFLGRKQIMPRMDEDDTMDVARLLCDLAPSAVLLEDDEGGCAIEYALCNSNSMDLARLLMRRSKRQRLAEVEARQQAIMDQYAASSKMNSRSSIRAASAA